ncbi:hypothetical protein EJD96_15850 [Herbaspirillum seropedicae]|uniref:Imm52 family immunity protein n=1 Tax=Herbaspirillum seropedicae TaxID=964 RepID=UPI00111D2EFA|nr:Imm52 family immunity protein [Herbaspirillum seropedicae]QDD65527.1 hypothetical protein EJD96_15850 [Herbaspirillum seropedicae]
MHTFDIEIFSPPDDKMTLEARMGKVRELLLTLGKYDSLLMPKEWMVATGDQDGSFRYPAFDGDIPSRAMLAYYTELFRKEGPDSPRLVALWNGQLQHGVGADCSLQFNSGPGQCEKISIGIDDISKWQDWSAMLDVVKTSVRLYAPRTLFVQPNVYQPVFFDKPSVGWMLYLPRSLSHSQVPEARRLEPVLDNDGKQIGTVVISVDDAIFDVGNSQHVKIANDIEIRLADQDLLPRFPTLLP